MACSCALPAAGMLGFSSACVMPRASSTGEPTQSKPAEQLLAVRSASLRRGRAAVPSGAAAAAPMPLRRDSRSPNRAVSAEGSLRGLMLRSQGGVQVQQASQHLECAAAELLEGCCRAALRLLSPLCSQRRRRLRLWACGQRPASAQSRGQPCSAEVNWQGLDHQRRIR